MAKLLRARGCSWALLNSGLRSVLPPPTARETEAESGLFSTHPLYCKRKGAALTAGGRSHCALRFKTASVYAQVLQGVAEDGHSVQLPQPADVPAESRAAG